MPAQQQPAENNGTTPPAFYSPLSLQGHSLNDGLLTCNEGQFSNVAQLQRQRYQAGKIRNFQQLTRGIWSNRGTGWQPQRAGVFNSGAAFMDFGVYEDFVGNQTLLFQVGNTVYSYNIATSTETAYSAPLNSLSTSIANLPCMRSFVDQTGVQPPITIYCNGQIQPQQITGTASNNVSALPFTATGSPTTTNPNGGQFGIDYSISTYEAGTYITSYSTGNTGVNPTRVCLGSDGNVWFIAGTSGYIGKITPLGVVTLYACGSGTANAICSGPDNRLWVAYSGNANFTAHTTAGVMTSYNTNGLVTTGSAICTDGTYIYIAFSGTATIHQYNVSGTYVTAATHKTYDTNTMTYGLDGRLWTTDGANHIEATQFSTNTTTVYSAGLSSSSITGGICSGPAGSSTMYFCDLGTNSIGTITIAGNINEYVVPTAGAQPTNLCLGSDGNIWFTETNTQNIGKFTVSNNSITEFSGPPAGAAPKGICVGIDGNLWFAESGIHSIGTFLLTTIGLRGITVGADGRLWFCEYATNKIGALTVQGALSEYPLPNNGSGPFGICLGPDGNVWFTEQLGNRIGKITPAGVITEYSLSTTSSVPMGICSGPDGRLWFCEYNNNKIGAITTSGTITEYAITTANSQPYGICSDGTNLWFCESNGNKIGKITTAGTVTEYTVPTPNALPFWIALGKDGRLWFTENKGNKIGAITTAGVVSEFTIPTSGSQPEQITAASDGNLYFVEAEGNNIGRITTAGAIVEFPIDINNAEPFGIVDGPDQSLWFTLNGASEVGNFLYGGSGTWPGVFQLTKKTYSAPRFSCYFNNRMAYFGFAPGSNAALDVLISSLGKASNFQSSTPIQATDAVSFTIPGLGLPTGMYSFRLTNTNNQEVLVLGFQRGIAVIMGNQTSTDATTMACTILTREYGIPSNRAFVQVQNDLYFWTTNGVRNFSNLTINANLLNSALTWQMQDYVNTADNLTPVPSSQILYASQAFAIGHSKALELQFWFPSTASPSTNDSGIIMNYNTANPNPQQLMPVFSEKGDFTVACGIEFKGVFYGGGYDGTLQQHYTGNTFNGAPINGQILLSLASAGNAAESQELRQGVIVVQGQAQNFQLDTNFYTKMPAGNLVQTPDPRGSQNLSSPSTGFIDHVYFEDTGIGNYIEHTLSTNGAGQYLDFCGLGWIATVGGLRS